MAKWLPPNGFTGKVHHLDAKVGEGDRRGLAKCEGQFACLIRAGSHWRDRGNFSVKPDPDELNGAEGPSSYNESHGFAGPLKPLQARDL